MATTKKDYIFKGKASWLLKKPNDWGNYTVNFYPGDAATRKAVTSTGIRNKLKEDDGVKSGVEGFFYTLKSDGPHKVFNADGTVYEGYVGNGSEVSVKLI